LVDFLAGVFPLVEAEAVEMLEQVAVVAVG
jgi:hypothetical protein